MRVLGGQNVSGLRPARGFGLLRWGPTLLVSDRTLFPLEGLVFSAAPGGVTVSATFTVSRPATLVADLGKIDGLAAFTVDRAATLQAPLGGVTASATFTVDRPATLEASLGGVSGRAEFVVSRPASIQAPLGGLVASATLVVSRPATLAADLGALAGSATFTVERPATLAADLGGLAASATFTAAPPGGMVLEASLGGLVASATFTVERPATVAADLGELVASATFTAAPPTNLFLEASLGGLVASATVTVTPRPYKLERLAGPYSSLLDFNPRRRRAQAGDSILVRLDLRDSSGAIDFSTAPLRQFVFRRPDGSALVRTATAPASLGRLEFRFAAGELDQAGVWSVQARVVKAGGAELRSAPREFEVGWNLPTV